MKLKKAFCVCLALIFALALFGCVAKQEEPVTVTLWHVYGTQTDSPLNDMIRTFNETVGKEQNIRVEVTFVSTNKMIHQTILASAHGDPGAAPLPDMFVTYPKTVFAMPDEEILLDYKTCFTREELDGFMPEFLSEGTIHDRLLVLPVAKSTEMLYLNKTIFDAFSAETGVKMEDLNTWEGLFAAAQRYAAWTDAKTPEVEGDARAMVAHDFHFNYVQVGVESLGEAFFDRDRIAFGRKFRQVWEPYANAAISGGLWLKDGYATEPMRTVDAIAAIASSAGVHYFSDVVTFPNNTSQKMEWIVRPVPIFQDGKKMVMQRGAGICTVKSTPRREQACVTFLKWLTDVENNVRFTTKMGYMPVKKAAFEQALPQAVKELKEPKYAELYQAYLQTQKEYTFYTAPQIEQYLELEDRFEETARNRLNFARNQFLRGEGSLEELQIESLKKLMESFT